MGIEKNKKNTKKLENERKWKVIVKKEMKMNNEY